MCNPLYINLVFPATLPRAVASRVVSLSQVQLAAFIR